MTEKTVKTKKPTKAKAVKEEKAPVKKERYFEAIGRRKESVARVRLYPKKSGYEINGKNLNEYFPISRLQGKVIEPLNKINPDEKFGVVAKVSGGGSTGQAEAVRLGVSRALVVFNSELRKKLRRFDLLTRDSRAVERKKFGLKKARRAPQWKKR